MEVKVYSAPHCPWCEATKNFLQAHNISFQDINAAADEKVAQEIIKKSGQMNVPVTEINGKIVVGFNKSLLEKYLGLTGYD